MSREPTQTCSACRLQRKRCDRNCDMAQYFPASKYCEFQNAHKLFGMSNIQKMMNSVLPEQRKATADSILIEGNARSNDLVHGCQGIVRNIKSQIQLYENEFELVNRELAFFRERERQNPQEILNSTLGEGLDQPTTEPLQIGVSGEQTMEAASNSDEEEKKP
ncbi:hypothetical protein ACOSP7_015171 [Xanthoceras sorbifolium]